MVVISQKISQKNRSSQLDYNVPIFEAVAGERKIAFESPVLKRKE
ncbi:hypothetical protein CPter291_2055 [Collimonas pratensis]|uniref:Uncharacterized protein n=1 Tax=Collimonas pratensis TaxID=279113 RepID=A0ABN4MC96_9BURK|nr:hypothetical protein CPter291_2055 [Collimonas pratensis]